MLTMEVPLLYSFHNFGYSHEDSLGRSSKFVFKIFKSCSRIRLQAKLCFSSFCWHKLINSRKINAKMPSIFYPLFPDSFEIRIFNILLFFFSSVNTRSLLFIEHPLKNFCLGYKNKFSTWWRHRWLDEFHISKMVKLQLQFYEKYDWKCRCTSCEFFKWKNANKLI